MKLSPLHTSVLHTKKKEYRRTKKKKEEDKLQRYVIHKDLASAFKSLKNNSYQGRRCFAEEAHQNEMLTKKQAEKKKKKKTHGKKKDMNYCEDEKNPCSNNSSFIVFVWWKERKFSV